MADTGNPTQRYLDVGNVTDRLLLPIDGYQYVAIMPLNEAIVKIKHLLPHINAKVFVAIGNSKNPEDGLTQHESAAIQLYTMEWLPEDTCLYYVLNKTLRSEKRQHLIPWFPYLKLVLTALWKLPPVKRSVWRGIKADVSDQYLQGQTYTWWNFSSCANSLNLMESEQFLGQTGVRTLFNIECENGKAIKNHSHYQEEDEILLLPGFHFEVVGKTSPSSNLHIIHIRETMSEIELLVPPFGPRRPVTVMQRRQRLEEKPPASTSHTDPKVPTSQPVVSVVVSKSPASTSVSVIKTEKHSSFTVPVGATAAVHVPAKMVVSEKISRISEELLTNTAYRKLHLSHMNITLDEMRMIAEALKENTTVTELYISSSDLVDDQVKLIAEALKINNTLTRLFLYNNKITDVGGIAIADALLMNKSLVSLNMEKNELSSLVKTKIENVGKTSRGTSSWYPSL